MSHSALIALADGTVLRGTAIGYSGQVVGELVFNTAMTGYQEVLTDPSYTRQIVTFTHPHIGNVGVNEQDYESQTAHIEGLVVRHLSPVTSNWRSQQSLGEFLQQKRITGIADIDTRYLTTLLRDKGTQNACITHRIDEPEQAIAAAQNGASLMGLDLAKEVSTTTAYRLGDAAQPHHVVAYDYGTKQSILDILLQRHCHITVVPATTSVQEVMALKPSGVFLSNGPGDPAACHYAIDAIQTLLGHNIPLFGICLGHQLLALACGAKTIKMKFGHHGINHPVEDVTDKRVLITSQNHGFTVDDNTFPTDLVITHRSLFDGSIQGIRHVQRPAYAFQGHPEANPGPHDAIVLFDRFIALMQQVNHA